MYKRWEEYSDISNGAKVHTIVVLNDHDTRDNGTIDVIFAARVHEFQEYARFKEHLNGRETNEYQ